MRYGMPYKGSKNLIAKKIIDILPPATHFVDLFCGGCAVSHCAMASGKYNKFIINDINKDIVHLFCDCLNGKFKNEKRWISRDDFFKLKDDEPYIKYCWSFGNNGNDYLYSKVIEPWKKALHYARVMNDFSLMEQFGIYERDLSRTSIKKHFDEYKSKYIKWYIENFSDTSEIILKNKINTANLERIQHNERLRDLVNNSQKLYQLQSHGYLKGLQNLSNLKNPELMQSLKGLERLERLQNLDCPNLTEIQFNCYNLSYEQVVIPENSVIYCDIPYKNTKGYNTKFDHDYFYKWAKKQKNIFISELSMPDDFIRIASFPKRQTYSATDNSTYVEEGIFIPKNNI